ncbi:MAG: Gfo/Idh/MocA family oxidoreductase, partial [Tunicatimonas sp.]
MINVALASFGMSGLVFHGPLLSVHPHFRLHAVLERNRSDSQERYPDVKLVRKYEDLLTDESVEVIVVNTPNPFHYDMAEAALQAGKHVVVEKPFTNTTKEGEQLIALAEKKGRVLTVFQNRRWDSDFLTVQKVLAADVLGTVVEYEAHYDRFRNFIQPDTWKEEVGPGSGILYNLGSHMIDQALVLFGMPKTLFAKLSIQRKGGKAPDAYHLILGYETMQVVLKSSYLVRDQGPRYKVLGSEGTFTKYGLDPQEDLLKLGVSPDNSRIGQEPETDWGT